MTFIRLAHGAYIPVHHVRLLEVEVVKSIPPGEEGTTYSAVALTTWGETLPIRTGFSTLAEAEAHLEIFTGQV